MSAFKGQKKVVEVVYDFAKHGGAVGFIDLTDPAVLAGAMKLPQGMVISEVAYRVITAPTSGGAATIAIGDAASGAVFLAATAYNNAAYALDNVAKAAIGVPRLVDSADKQKLGITVAAAALTAGKIAFWVEGYVPRNQS